MSGKRQTIWLVSMLFLMVVLSAYYLLTEQLDSNKLQEVTQLEDAEQVSNMEGTAENGSYELTELDHEVLAQLEADGYFSASVFSQILNERNDQYLQEENKQYALIADATVDGEQAVSALAELEQLEAKNEKKLTLENLLLEQYEMALVSEEENDKFKVVIASDQLEKKEAAAIIEQVISTLEVNPEQVSVQFVPAP